MRVATIFKRVLGLGAVSVARAEVVDRDGEQVIEVEITRRSDRRMFCSGCGGRCTAIYDRGVRKWRHLDVFRVRCFVIGEVRRVSCPACGVKPEVVAWARPAARVTRAFEDTCVWLARSAPKSVVAQLQRVDWHSVGMMTSTGRR